MKSLGISGRYREAAAALAVDGRVIAAASEDCFTRVPGIGYTQTGGFPFGAVEACLAAAALTLTDVDEITVVDGEGEGERGGAGALLARDGRVRTIDAVRADALQASVCASGADAVLVCGPRPPVMASFVRGHDGLRPQGRVAGGEDLVSAAETLAQTLGVSEREPFRALDRLSVGEEPHFLDDFDGVFKWTERSVAVDADRLTKAVQHVAGPHAGKLADVSSLNVRLQETRRAIAASFTCRLAQVIRDAAESLCARGNLSSMTFGGAIFANARLTTELKHLVGEGLSVAMVPEASGRALGAALASGSAAVDPLSGLALGPGFSDVDIKRTLDNCRLDYVYEPDWPKLLARVSKMLSHGKVIAWFQGPMAFGPRAMGTRSILCDPSNRYVRQNVNEYLRQVALDEPLPISFAPSVVDRCLGAQTAARLAVLDVPIAAEWRERLIGALDWRGRARVHSVGLPIAPELDSLLECHLGRTGVPGLIEANLCGPGEPVACTPRDAVRTVYSSAIDALVIGRFVLMKDYWLLRSNVD